MRLLLFSTVLLLFPSMILAIYAEESEQNYAVLISELSKEPIEINDIEYNVPSEGPIKVSFTVKNNQESSTVLTLIEINPEPFSTKYEKNISISSDSSVPIFIDVPRPEIAGSYNFAITVTDQNLKSDTEIISFSFVKEKSRTEKIGTSLDEMLLLLVIFLIPSQFIERIVEHKKKHHKSKDEHIKEVVLAEEQIKTLTTIKEKIVEKISSNYPQNEIVKILKPKISKSLLDRFLTTHQISEKERQKISSFLLDDGQQDSLFSEIKTINDKIKDLKKTKWDHEVDHAVECWAYACLFSIIPAMVLSLSGVGLFNFIGIEKILAIPADVVVNTLFIGSGTKPLHDIITWIAKIRK